MRRIVTPSLVAIALALPVAAIAATAFAAEPVTETSDIAGVTRIEIGGPATVTISIGTPERLMVTAVQEDLDRIDVERDDDKLAVDFDEGLIFHREPEEEIRYDITVASLAELELHGTVDATVAGITGQELKLDVSGSSHATLDDIALTSLDVGLSGASTVEAAGSTEMQEIDVSGASVYQGDMFDSRSANVEVSGASNATVRATEALHIRASGASTVEYIAPPDAAVEIDTSGASSAESLPYTPLPAATPQPATPRAVSR
jgi:hypothetical protein